MDSATGDSIDCAFCGKVLTAAFLVSIVKVRGCICWVFAGRLGEKDDIFVCLFLCF